MTCLGDVPHMVECTIRMRDVRGLIPHISILYRYEWVNKSNIEDLWLFYFHGYQSTSNGGQLGTVIVKVGGSIPLWSCRIPTSISRITWNKWINFQIWQGRPFHKHNDNALQIFLSTGFSKATMLAWRVLARNISSMPSSNVLINTAHHHLVLVLMYQSQRPREGHERKYLNIISFNEISFHK